MSMKAYFIIFLLAVMASCFYCLNQPQQQSSEFKVSEQLSEDTRLQAVNEPKVRTKRGIFWDFFQKIVTTKNLAVDQYVDTRNSLNEVFNLLNAGFSDPAPTKPTLPSSSTKKTQTASDEDDDSTTTTTEYTISRYEFGKILGRNFRGLQRLTKIELDDAYNQSKYNIQEYKAEARKQFANSVAVEAKDKLKILKG